MRRVVGRGVLDDLREGGEARAQGQLALVVEAAEVGAAEVGQHAVPLPQHRAQAGVGVLDVIHRVLVALALGEVEVEIQVLVGLAQHVEEAAGVVADLVAQLAQGDELAGAGGHRRLLAVAVEHRELHQRHVELLGRQAQRLQGALHAGDVAVVVGAPDVDDAVEAALVLVGVVGDVGGEVGEQAVLTLDHAVLLVAEGGRAEPLGAVLHIQVAAGLELGDGLLDQAGVEQRALGEPLVEGDAELLQIFAAVAELLGEGETMHPGVVAGEQALGVGDQRVEVAFLVGLDRRRVLQHVGGGDGGKAVAVAFLDLGGHLLHVVALVGVGREGHGDAEEVEVAQPGGQRQDVHLPPGVVDVVLAGHVEAGELEHVGERGAVGGAAAVADVERAGGVGRDELDLHLDAALLAAAEGLALVEHALHDGRLGVGGQREVDEAGAGHLGLGHQGRGRQLGQQQARQFARVALEGLGELQGQVAREIPVPGLLRTFQVDGGVGLFGGHAQKRGAQEVGKLGLGIGAHGKKLRLKVPDYIEAGGLPAFALTAGANKVPQA